MLKAEERSIPLSKLIDGLPAGCEQAVLGLQVMGLAQSIVLVSFSAEPTSGWSDIVGDLIPGKAALTVGYANQVFGYLPTAREAIQGGYEAVGFMRSFGLSGSFAPEFADRVKRELATLLADMAEPVDASDYADHVALLRETIDRLLDERDHIRARMLKDRTTSEAAVKLAEARLAAAQGHADQLSAATAHMRRQLRAELVDAPRSQDGIQERMK
jgi:hypothetical protein